MATFKKSYTPEEIRAFERRRISDIWQVIANKTNVEEGEAFDNIKIKDLTEASIKDIEDIVDGSLKTDQEKKEKRIDTEAKREKKIIDEGRKEIPFKS